MYQSWRVGCQYEGSYKYKHSMLYLDEQLWAFRRALQSAGFLFEPPQYISYFSLSRSAVLTISHLWRVSFCYLKTCLAQNHFQLCSCVKWAIHGGETPPNTVGLNALAVLKQRREADAALFSELHRKLQTQVGIWISLKGIITHRGIKALMEQFPTWRMIQPACIKQRPV